MLLRFLQAVSRLKPVEAEHEVYRGQVMLYVLYIWNFQEGVCCTCESRLLSDLMRCKRFPGFVQSKRALL